MCICAVLIAVIHTALSVPYFQLIEVSLQAAAQDILDSERAEIPVEHQHSLCPLTLPGIHLVHAAVQHRLQLCAQTFQLCPDIVTKLITQYEPRQKSPTEQRQEPPTEQRQEPPTEQRQEPPTEQRQEPPTEMVWNENDFTLWLLDTC